jgi:hypothetical protein
MTAPSRQAEMLGIDAPGARDRTKAPKSRAVTEQRHSARDALDFFPTPPWGTRALVEIVLRDRLGFDLEMTRIWEPAAGEGHMAEVLREYKPACVFASDVHRYPEARGRIDRIGSFTGEGLDVVKAPDFRLHERGPGLDFVITNPPFNLAEQFLERALREAEVVCLLLRSNFIDTQGRYERVFSKTPPLCVAQFAERLPMHEGRWDPDGDTATSYAWFVWARGNTEDTRLIWIPTGQREALERPHDRERFGMKQEASLI